jgi:uncharacterized protein YidB (DUF937 family)
MSTNLWSALIAAVTALVVFVLTQYVVGRREKRGRLVDLRTTALRDAQDAALQVRNALAEYGPLARQTSGAPSEALLTAQRTVDAAFARLDVAMTRVDDASIGAAVQSWRGQARWHYVSAEEVTTAEERALWEAMNARFGAALTSVSARP